MGILLALTGAFVWGSGDYAGGLATRRGHQLHVLALSALSGVVALLALSWASAEGLPSRRSTAWAAAAGAANSVGLASLYRGLARSRAATVAPTAAVITAAVPLVFSTMTAGLPRPTELAGFALAIVGIWLVAQISTSTRSESRDRGLGLAILAGCGFGAFLTMIAQVQPDLVFGPLGVSKAVMLVGACVLIFWQRQALPSLLSSPLALLAGAFDAGGNVLYLMARQHVRLDVAAVLSSLYPVATILLARVVSGEPVTRQQWVGTAVCLAAVGLITA